MVFYIIIIGIIEFSISWMLIGQDLRRTGGPLQVTVCHMPNFRPVRAAPRNQLGQPSLCPTLTNTRDVQGSPQLVFY